VTAVQILQVLGLVLAVMTPTIAALAWLFRIDGRLTLVEARYQDIKVDLAEIKNDLKKVLYGRGVTE
jgi:hypothetical protein